MSAFVLVVAGPAGAANDPRNPTCPVNPNWAASGPMKFTPTVNSGRHILLAEGQIDAGVVARLQAALAKEKGIDEIWLRSPGGDARAGTEAGKLIRQTMIPTRIPSGWACFSACNFMFMGGVVRYVDPGGHFVVHMFTHVGDKEAVRSELKKGTDNAIGLIGDVEQDSALLASEDNDFLIRMGVSRKLLTDVMYQQKAVADDDNKSTRRCLTQDEDYKYNVATKILN